MKSGETDSRNADGGAQRARDWYHHTMTTVDVEFRYEGEPGASVAAALAHVKDVYGIRRLSVDRAAHQVRVEYDATRLNGPTVAGLLKGAGLAIVEEISLIPEQPVAAETTP